MAMAIAPSRASGASGLDGLFPPAPPPVRGSDVVPAPLLAAGAWDTGAPETGDVARFALAVFA